MDSLLRSDDSLTLYWRFLQGFLLGQLTLLGLLYLLFKYWFLEDKIQGQGEQISKVSDKLKVKLKRQRDLEIGVKKNFQNQKAPLSLADAEILSKTFYELLEHPTESCDWLNVLLAQIMNLYRNELLISDQLIKALEASLNSGLKPGFLGPITLSDLSLGQEFPRLKDAFIDHKKSSSSVFGEVTIEYNDRITVGLDTSILVGIKGITIAALPISLSLSLVKFLGKMVIEFSPDNEDPSLNFTILPDYELEFEVNTLIGHRSKLKDLPKVASMLIYRLKSMFQKHFVQPNNKTIKLPSVEALLARIIKANNRNKEDEGMDLSEVLEQDLSKDKLYEVLDHDLVNDKLVDVIKKEVPVSIIPQVK